MISDELKNILDSITVQGKMRFLEGATKEQILFFENGNGIALPAQYKEWLEYSDGGGFFLPAGVQMYGVAHNPMIDVNDSDRPDEEYVVIGALASGDPILCKKEGEQIAIYNYEDGRIEADEIYQNFYAFLSDLYDLLEIGERFYVKENGRSNFLFPVQVSRGATIYSRQLLIFQAACTSN